MAVMGVDDGNVSRRQDLKALYALIIQSSDYLMVQNFLTWNLCQLLHVYRFFKGMVPQVSFYKGDRGPLKAL